MEAPANKTLSRILPLVLIVFNIVTLAALWFAVVRRPGGGPPPMNRGEGGTRPVDFLRRELGFSEEQMAAFTAQRDKFITAIEPLHAEVRALNEELVAELEKTAPDEARIEALTARIGTLRGEEGKRLFLHFKDLMSVCRPDQQAKFRSISRRFMETIGFFGPAGLGPSRGLGPGEKPGFGRGPGGEPGRGPGSGPPPMDRPDKPGDPGRRGGRIGPGEPPPQPPGSKIR